MAVFAQQPSHLPSQWACGESKLNKCKTSVKMKNKNTIALLIFSSLFNEPSSSTVKSCGLSGYISGRCTCQCLLLLKSSFLDEFESEIRKTCHCFLLEVFFPLISESNFCLNHAKIKQHLAQFTVSNNHFSTMKCTQSVSMQINC